MTSSVRVRFLASLVSNSLKAVFSFLTGLLVARGLTPAGYGDLTFLLGSFVSIRTLLDLGTYNAFYTFISQERRPLRYYTYYCGWLLFQFLLTLSVVGLVLPDGMISAVWVGQERPVVLLALTASFFQQQVWLTVNQIGEAARKTVKVQALNAALAAFYLAAVYLMRQTGVLSIRSVLLLVLAQYAAGAAIAYRLLGPPETSEDGAAGSSAALSMLGQYRAYCAPLAALSLISFFYDFADKWLLQRFAGAAQQGFYQAAFQLATVSVIATSSILNIFWKEMAEALRVRDDERVARLFVRVSRGLYALSAFLSASMIPWSGEIVRVFLGEEYVRTGPVLALMLLYPVHQSLGQIAGTMLLAGERTRQHMTISAAFMLASLPVSYLLQAPASAAVPGLDLGAMGLAIKMVALNVVSVNATLWVVARNQGWRFDWGYQIAGLGSALLFGYASRLGAEYLLGPAFRAGGGVNVFPLAVSGALYLAASGTLLWRFPRLAGIDRGEFTGYFVRARGAMGGMLRGSFLRRVIC